MSAVQSATEQKLDFMKLLVTEMQYQNPLEPMDNQQMAAQLAQFSQLELTEKMNTNLETINETISNMNLGFTGAMIMAELEYARSLLGHTISFYNETYQQSLEGPVQGIRFVNGEPVLQVQVQVSDSKGSVSEQTVQVKLDEIEGIQ
ncbi:MAG TPA: flagellar hook capping FlgD N-terminal domain-containing protein [Anaerohalosphaeraceae bacterium]|nr:flagellar hook capping FlgD N-terminal domain-containing protein [Anaerohalosphaeraceae bacterium]